VLAGLALAAVIVAVQALAGLVQEATTDDPSHLELVQTCLTERSIPFEPAVGDPIALSAERGALRTSVEGNAVTVALGGSESDAGRLFDAYTAVGSADVPARLERHRKVVLLWDVQPTAAQRDFMELCTLDARD
jgi:hypothetical protein